MQGSSRFLPWQVQFKAKFVNIPGEWAENDTRFQKHLQVFCRNETSLEELSFALPGGGWLSVCKCRAASAEKPCGEQSCASSAVPASCASPHPARRAHRVITSCADVMAHKPEQIPLLQAPISRTWSFDARESCGQTRAAAVSARSAFPGLLLTTLPPSAAAGKGTDLRPGGSGSLPPPRE